jgi:hypothetical protein
MVSIVSGDSMIKISLGSLEMLVRKNSQVESFAGYGTLVGFALGAIIGASIHQEPTFHQGVGISYQVKAWCVVES